MPRPKKPDWFALFEVWQTDDQIKDSYARSFGKPPATIKRTGGGVLAGPLPDDVARKRREGRME